MRPLRSWLTRLLLLLSGYFCRSQEVADLGGGGNVTNVRVPASRRWRYSPDRAPRTDGTDSRLGGTVVCLHTVRFCAQPTIT